MLTSSPLRFALFALLLAGIAYLAMDDARPQIALPELVIIPPGDIAYRPMGNFTKDGKAAVPHAYVVHVDSFEIMKYQVSRDQYASCVSDGGCAAVPTGTGVLPQTQVNWIDATAYARWLSARSGQNWQLPTAPQWQRAAAERAGDVFSELDADEDVLDPGARMLAQYKTGTLLRGTHSSILRPPGDFGVNSFGVADLAGNVWEWTDACLANGIIHTDGSIALGADYCGVRIAGGAHQAAVINFVRDASVGGCAVGLPPDHLGFRLVRSR
tara:strand:- start:19861 stop:20670 length:810 start_codon:yes stop_codon:yes gene_type:complete